MKSVLMVAFRSALGASEVGCRVSALRQAGGREKSSHCLKGTLKLGGTRATELRFLGMCAHSSPQVVASS